MIDALRDTDAALSYLYSLIFGEVCEPQDRAWYFGLAREQAIKAIVANRKHLEPNSGPTHVDRVRAERAAAAVAIQHRLPVKEHLRAERNAAAARCAAALPVIAAWDGEWTESRRAQARGFLALATRLVDTAAQAAEPLPMTTLCACQRCYRVTLPGWHGTYGCKPCGVWWGPDPRAGHTALPATFWAKKLPGDPSGLRRDEMEKTA